MGSSDHRAFLGGEDNLISAAAAEPRMENTILNVFMDSNLTNGFIDGILPTYFLFFIQTYHAYFNL
jgi:hypothetical protein